MSTEQLAKEIRNAALDIKAEDPTVLDVSKLTSFTDYFVIVSGRSDRQVQAIADNILEKLREKKIKPLGVEGYETGHWILMDFGTVVAHIFYTETRLFYALEKLWSDAPRISWDESEQEAAP